MRTMTRSSLPIALSLAVLLSATPATQTPDPALFRQRCPPCDPVTAAQDLGKLPAEILREYRWSLGPKGVNADEWIARQEPNTARRLSFPLGKGSRIMQVDTGVTKHPMLPVASELDLDASGVGFFDANDFYGEGHRNFDLLLPGFLRFPGHGTKTSSVIIGSPWNSELKDANGNAIPYAPVSGLAQGARLVPIRGTQGVLLLPAKLGELETEQWRITKALRAAGASREGAGMLRRIDVVTMSLGGWPPASGICDAVSFATSKGVIVVAAAGNEIKRTKYPAKCKDAIAVAGSTYAQAPWSGSAGSDTVAAAAPAEGVWTASVVNGHFCLEASTGTSFAVALVAGMAAEWVAFHRSRGITLKNPQEEFRAALMQTARPWTGNDAAKWRGRFGAGIADLTRLMEKAENDARGSKPPAASTAGTH